MLDAEDLLIIDDRIRVALQAGPDRTAPISTFDAAKRLGISVALLRQLVDAGTIRAIRIGPKLWRIPVGEVERILARGTA